MRSSTGALAQGQQCPLLVGRKLNYCKRSWESNKFVCGVDVNRTGSLNFEFSLHRELKAPHNGLAGSVIFTLAIPRIRPAN